MSMFILGEMTWPEIKEALKSVKIAIIPVGAHEQHGPHLVESCDGVLATEMSKKLAYRLHPFSIVAPTVNMGVSMHHMHFPGTITLQPSTLISIIRDMVVSLKQHGIEYFLLLNSHGGNQSTLNIACTQLSYDLGVQILYAKTTASANQSIKKHVTSTLFGHSCEREVSEAYYLAPSLVRTDCIEKGEIQEGNWRLLRGNKGIQGPYFYEQMTKNGCLGDATKASYEIGREIVEEALDNLENSIRELINLSSK